jgi:hypothetical protein
VSASKFVGTAQLKTMRASKAARKREKPLFKKKCSLKFAVFNLA